MKNVLQKLSLSGLGFFIILYCNNVTATTYKRISSANATTAKNLSKETNTDKKTLTGSTPNVSFSKSVDNDSSKNNQLVIDYKNMDFYGNVDNIDFYKNMYKDVRKLLDKNTSNLIVEIKKLVSQDKIDRLHDFVKELSEEPINSRQNICNKKKIVDKNMQYFVVFLREYRKIVSIITITHLHVLITCAMTLDFTKELTEKEISDTIKDCYNPGTKLYELSRAIFKQRVALANAGK